MRVRCRDLLRNHWRDGKFGVLAVRFRDLRRNQRGHSVYRVALLARILRPSRGDAVGRRALLAVPGRILRRRSRSNIVLCLLIRL